MNLFKLFVERFPQTTAPSRQDIYKLVKRFEESGTVHDLPKSGKFFANIFMCVIIRRVTTDWPPRSCDSTTLYFCYTVVVP